ncbi:MAG: DNA-3-methyladenine glycosylase I [Plesiomonas sp.]|uniref:DNA-3-methyladenine glycosylase I n=1 Tax=Plesiomonas sp. TaxID=2486279 RepID=UPI003F34278D
MQRCQWVSADLEYQDYHDTEWGVPCYDSRALFELLCLEGQQAGLSWITVLKKRAHYRACFYQFDPQQMAAMSEEHIALLLTDRGLIRHRLKLQALVKNAQAYLAMQQRGEDFSAFIWSFVGGVVRYLQSDSCADMPTESAESNAMSRALRKRGFTFVGPTLCYAFMQAAGLVNDHQQCCDWHHTLV